MSARFECTSQAIEVAGVTSSVVLLGPPVNMS